MKQTKLKRELRSTNATRQEAGQLAYIARSLQSAAPKGMEIVDRRRIAQSIGFNVQASQWNRRLALSGILAVFVVVLFAAQLAQPGSALYAFKRGSEEVLIHVQPNFDESDLADRRKSELEQLRQKQADQDRIQKANEEYQRALERSDRHQRGTQEDQNGGIAPDTRESSGSGSGSFGGADSNSNSGNSGSGSDSGEEEDDSGRSGKD